MHLVKQYNDNACFGACLESFLSDLTEDFSHEAFIKNNLNLFHGNTDQEGTCDTENYFQVANLLGLNYKIYDITKFIPPSTNEAIFFTTFWDNDKSKIHCVRFSHRDGSYLHVMNPAFPKIMPMTKWWIRQIHRFTKLK